MSEQGKVIKVENNTVTVIMQRSEACAKCRACITSGKEMQITAKNECGAKVDDWVNIELNTSVFLSAVLIMYGVPFIFLLTGMASGYYISIFLDMENIKELIGFVVGIIFLLLSYAYIRSREWKTERHAPSATEVIHFEPHDVHS